MSLFTRVSSKMVWIPWKTPPEWRLRGPRRHGGAEEQGGWLDGEPSLWQASFAEGATGKGLKAPPEYREGKLENLLWDEGDSLIKTQVRIVLFTVFLVAFSFLTMECRGNRAQRKAGRLARANLDEVGCSGGHLLTLSAPSPRYFHGRVRLLFFLTASWRWNLHTMKETHVKCPIPWFLVTSIPELPTSKDALQRSFLTRQTQWAAPFGQFSPLPLLLFLCPLLYFSRLPAVLLSGQLHCFLFSSPAGFSYYLYVSVSCLCRLTVSVSWV